MNASPLRAAPPSPARPAPPEAPGLSWAASPHRRALLWAALTLLFTAATAPLAAEATVPGLDPSYRFAFNYFFDHGVEVGRQVLFTYGPLGFVLFPQPVGHNLLWANLFLLGLVLVFSGLFWAVVLRHLHPAHPWQALAAALLAALAGNLLGHLGAGNLLFMITLLGLLACRPGRAPWPLLLSLLAAGLAFALKPAFAILAFALLGSHLLIEGVRRRRPLVPLGGLLLGVLSLVGCWALAGGTLAGLPRFLRATWELSLGNASAMTISLGVAWLPIAAALLLCVWLTAVRLLRPALMLALLLPALLWLKYAYARPDHAPLFLEFSAMVLFAGLFTLDHPRLKPALLVGALLALGLISSSVQLLPFPRTRSFTLWRFLAPALRFEGPDNLAGLAEIQRLHRRMEARSRQHLRQKRLSAPVRRRIGQRTVDIYPWELSYVPANGLNWRPRPVIQSYITYTPWLDAQNAAHMSGPRAPQVLLWDLAKVDGPMWSIDRRYLLNDEPLTMAAIVGWYKLCRADRKVALLRRRQRRAYRPPRVLGEMTAPWSRWFEVPQRKEVIVRARVQFRRTLYGELRRALYKEAELAVHYRLKNGRVRIHRVVPDSAASGLWVSPYLPNSYFRRAVRRSRKNPDGCPAGKRWDRGQTVTDVRFFNQTPLAYEDEVHLLWEEIEPDPDHPNL